MKKIFFCLALHVSLSNNIPLQAMAMPLTEEELQIAAEACEAHPYICYPLLAAQTACWSLLIGTIIVQTAKEYGAPVLTACFSCCKSKKHKRDEKLRKLNGAFNAKNGIAMVHRVEHGTQIYERIKRLK